MNQNNDINKGILGIVAALIVLGGLAFMLYYNDKETIVIETAAPGTGEAQGPSQKVAAANVEDGEYYARVETVTSSPEDTTITFRHVMYFEGEEARLTAENEGKSAEVRNGVYVRESGAPSFTAPLTAQALLTADEVRTLIADSSYQPVFLVVIEDGAIAGLSEVTKK